LFISVYAQSQGQNYNWHFGAGLRLNFPGSVGPIFLTGSALGTEEGCASISDAAGNLLFYTDGKFVWNQNNIQMPNGFGLLGGISGSSSQAAIIVPQPGSSTMYYIFTVDEDGGAGGFRYSIVDMSLNTGLGDVVTKNVLIHTPSCEKIAATYHCNGTDVWIVTHDLNSNQYRAVLLTAGGVGAPVVSALGPVIGSTLGASGAGCLKFSHDGTKAVITNMINPGLLDLIDFDNSTGTFSNRRALYTPAEQDGLYGIEFSPNNQLVYISNHDIDEVHQYDISSGVAASILASRTVLGTTSVGGNFGQIQIGPDGKIYFIQTRTTFVGCIQSPNVAGAGCNWTELYYDTDPLATGLYDIRFGLPSQLTYIPTQFSYPTNSYCQSDPAIPAPSFVSTYPVTGTFTSSPAGLSINPTTGVIQLSTSAAGTYTIRYTAAVASSCVSPFYSEFTLTVLPAPVVNITGDNTVCENVNVVLTASGGTSYSWTGPSWQGGGANSSSATLTNPGNATLGQSNEGWYYVNVSGGGCTSRDSIFIDILAVPSVSISNIPTACTNDLTATINSSNGGISGYEWTSNGIPPVLGTNSTLSYNPFAPDQIVVTVTDNEGCIGSASLVVNPISPLNISYSGGPFCTNGTPIPVSLTGTPGGTYTTTMGLTINSTTGEIAPTTSTPGTYTVTYTQGVCSTTTNVTINAAPTATLVYPSATICGLATSFIPSNSGTPGGVFSSTAGVTLNTSTGVINPSTSTPGTYTITYTIAASGSCPSVSDQFTVTIDAPTTPVVSFSFDPSYCTSATNPLPVLAVGFTSGGTFSSSAGISINASTGLIDLAASTAGTYSITYSVSASSPCIAAGTFSTSVTLIAPPVVSITGNTTICVGEQTTLTASGASTYQWTAGSSSTSAVITDQPGSSQTYTVIGTQSGCSSTASVLVNVLPVPIASVSGNLNICEGQSVTLNASGGNSYVWSGGQNTSAITISPTSTQNLYVVAINGSCTDTAFVTINVNPIPSLSATATPPVITLGESSQLNANSAGSTFSWTPSSSLSCSTCPDPVATPNSSTTYLVTATNSGGCTATATVVVIVDIVCGEIFTPEAFSPNNDGNNDEWCVYGNCITELDVQIFDRWGNMVRRMSSASDCWNGEVNGKIADQGVFMFQLNAKLLNGETVERKGSIYLMK
ncbi:MAG TPA: gliding motility-associated C-terminal domain-containing protein, partial [Flavobacteriales bacterium]|nr:gliding motility-associated C-terminal domain-containing protein [Flavobacteriales bacterium]